MFNELIFTTKTRSHCDAYAGGGAFLPSYIDWPKDELGTPLMHLLAIPHRWIDTSQQDDIWISVFIPYTSKEVKHYSSLRMRHGKSAAKVTAYIPALELRNEYTQQIFEAKTIFLSANEDEDDEENLSSKVLGVPAWLQDPIAVDGFSYALALYGGDLDIAFSTATGILADGMGYLFLSNDLPSALNSHDAGKFFLQLG